MDHILTQNNNPKHPKSSAWHLDNCVNVICQDNTENLGKTTKDFALG